MAVADQVHAGATARAFDGIAAEYHRTNVANPILAHMRRRSVATLTRRVHAGAALLDMGCGPGTDLGALCAAGYRVTAIDASPQMVHEARGRAAVAAREHDVRILNRSIEDLSRFDPGEFDVVFSNFGPLNCVADLDVAAADIRTVLKPGGLLVASVIGRVCPWEIALYAMRGDVARVKVRFARGRHAVPLKNETIWTTYVTPCEFRRTFEAAGFAMRELQGLGVVAPPPYLEAFARRHSRMVDALLQADAVIGRWPILRHVGDHFLVVLERS